jgi:hypothetical protein
MVVYTCLLAGRFHALLNKVHEIGRSEFAEACEAFGARVNGKADLIVFDDPIAASVRCQLGGMRSVTYSGTAGAIMLSRSYARASFCLGPTLRELLW